MCQEPELCSVMMMMMWCGVQDTVQGFDLESDTWELMKTKLPEPMTGVVACRVKLPQRLFDDYTTAQT